ncbi:hypothetical protein NDU88_002776 [Pleurodeles waltl]|uniref:Uncharacterized protein n=1 Tax=Pleurodeles waltl TaxID=8319 RepID=A0AAV7PB11_PLEWA|nr:hypothetical protein NDU88_002776 [Pleurodeles waltl]
MSVVPPAGCLYLPVSGLTQVRVSTPPEPRLWLQLERSRPPAIFDSSSRRADFCFGSGRADDKKPPARLWNVVGADLQVDPSSGLRVARADSLAASREELPAHHLRLQPGKIFSARRRPPDVRSLEPTFGPTQTRALAAALDLPVPPTPGPEQIAARPEFSPNTLSRTTTAAQA